jgi:hypothetical protein
MTYRDNIGAQTYDLMKCLYSANNHAEHMAKSAEALIDAIYRLDEADGEDSVQHASEGVTEAISALKSRIYQFRRRSQLYIDGNQVLVMDAAKIVRGTEK